MFTGYPASSIQLPSFPAAQFSVFHLGPGLPYNLVLFLESFLRHLCVKNAQVRVRALSLSLRGIKLHFK